jgi:integrase/recombinase XerD
MAMIQDAYVADLRLRGFTKTTVDSEVRLLRRYLAWCEARGLDPMKADKEDLKEYLAESRAKGHKLATLKKTFSMLASFYAWLEEDGRASAGPVRYIQKKYLRAYKSDAETRKLISVKEAAQMVTAAIDSRDRAILVVLFKTGIRREELVTLDLTDVNMINMVIKLKPTAKRTNRIVFFDDECREALSRWITVRARLRPESSALFTGKGGSRLHGGGVWIVVAKAAERVGLTDPQSKKLDERFSAHACRHWFTTHLLRAGMQREYVQWLRGDAIREAVDIYYHLDPEDVRRAYLAYIPQLGI